MMKRAVAMIIGALVILASVGSHAVRPASASMLSGSFWFSIDPAGDVEVWGDTQGSANVDEYTLYIGLGSCSGDCMTFDEGIYEGTAFPTHDHQIEMQGSNIALHGANWTTNQGGQFKLATLKFAGTVCRDLYFRNPGGGNYSDWWMDGDRLIASGTTGSTCD